MINMPGSAEKQTKPRQVIINIKIQNYGLQPSQRKHSMINLRGETKEIIDGGIIQKVTARHASMEERQVASSAGVSQVANRSQISFLESQDINIPQLKTIYHGPIQGSKITHAAANMILQKRKMNNRSMIEQNKGENLLPKATLDVIQEANLE
jgi:hypothetical protein